jgi:hypothetical protein
MFKYLTMNVSNDCFSSLQAGGHHGAAGILKVNASSPKAIASDPNSANDDLKKISTVGKDVDLDDDVALTFPQRVSYCH